jgi:ferredoxin
MLEKLKQVRDTGPKLILSPGSIPCAILYRPGQSNLVKFQDGSSAVSCCIGCEDRPCCYYSIKELSKSPMDEFPLDKIQQVCPSDAIISKGEMGFPTINSEECIMCGVCVSRCPTGAIFINPEVGAQVQTKSNDKFIKTDQIQNEEVEKSRLSFFNLKREGIILQESNHLVNIISMRSKLALKKNDRYPNILARNLLRTLGANAAIRRVGITSMRTDIVQKTFDDYPGVVEVEFGSLAILDVPRDILDDVAVIISRHNWSKGTFQTIVITDSLPNRRSEYWRIIADIKKVFPWLRIITISVLALMLAVWRQITLTSDFISLFYADENTKSYIDENIVKALNFRPNLTTGSNSWVQWVK